MFVGVTVGVTVIVGVIVAVGVIVGVMVGVTVIVGVGVGVLDVRRIVYGILRPFTLFTTIILVAPSGIIIGTPVSELFTIVKS